MHIWIFIMAYLGIIKRHTGPSCQSGLLYKTITKHDFPLCSFQGLQLFMPLLEIWCTAVSVHHCDKALFVFCKLEFITLVLMFSQQVVVVNYFLLLCNESCYIFISILLQSSEVLTSCEQFFNQVNL